MATGPLAVGSRRGKKGEFVSIAGACLRRTCEFYPSDVSTAVLTSTDQVLAVPSQKQSIARLRGPGEPGIVIAQALVPVRYTQSGQPIDGYFPLVVWENKTEPILGGREQSGVPKIFCDISESQVIGNHVFATASHDGHDFLRVDVDKKDAFTDTEVAARNKNSKYNLLGWRYIPNLGKPGAALSHATLYPQESILREGWKADGKVTWTKATWEQIPMQAHIINALADLPIKRYISSSVEKCRLILHPRLCRALP